MCGTSGPQYFPKWGTKGSRKAGLDRNHPPTGVQEEQCRSIRSPDALPVVLRQGRSQPLTSTAPRHLVTDSSAVHVSPINDLIEHDLESDDCICGPRMEPVKREDGYVGWVVVHHPMDGREFSEPDYAGAPMVKEAVR